MADEIEYVTCVFCSGSGQGATEFLACRECRGLGELRIDDFREEDEDEEDEECESICDDDDCPWCTDSESADYDSNTGTNSDGMDL
ncbi:MAG: hypothetical protein DRQ35_01405 [Gammaproteobacteria bacterium]|nr:MAG: hypothetical protein DRQ35_01405 [Gammaproteobacteria bacterium]